VVLVKHRYEAGLAPTEVFPSPKSQLYSPPTTQETDPQRTQTESGNVLEVNIVRISVLLV